MRQIVKLLPRERQTMLFSATQTTKARCRRPSQLVGCRGLHAISRAPTTNCG